VTRSPLPARGLYAITDSTLHTGAALERAVGRAIEGGAKVIQYRDKSDDGDRRHGDAARLVRLCRRHGVPMIVNDDVELALRAEADGVHIGRGDAELAAVRVRLGDGFIIGVSCYDATIAAVRERIRVPIVAIGGITPENGASLLQAGVDMLAVVRGVFGGDDPAVAAGHYRQLFDQHLQDEKA
jgi:thiamine-phosphate pyrophosphorylase